jgi:hypothetical protein
VSEDLRELERRHDVDRNSFIREAGDEVTLTKGVIHRKEA